MALKLHIFGATGKLGSQVVTAVEKDERIMITSTLDEADVALDVSSFLACQKHIDNATLLKKPLVIGTTGHTPENHALMKEASLSIPLLFAPNFSLAMAVYFEAALFLTQELKERASIEIIETHHKYKKDLPSGTALALAQTLNQETPPPIHSFREGEIIGEHTVIFDCQGERIELKHEVFSRGVFARGALEATLFLAHQKPGLYSMKDVIYATC